MNTIIDGTLLTAEALYAASIAGGPFGLVDDVSALLQFNQRSFAGIIPNVVLEEEGGDELRITEHPVEVGAAISDHAFKMPVYLQMRAGWSDSSGGEVGYIRRIYNELIALQARREPFTLYSGKRVYKNMLMANLTQVTDHKSEHALLTVIRFREVLLTYTSMSGAGSQNGTTPTNEGFGTIGTNSVQQFGEIAGITPMTDVGQIQPITRADGVTSVQQFGMIGGIS